MFLLISTRNIFLLFGSFCNCQNNLSLIPWYSCKLYKINTNFCNYWTQDPIYDISVLPPLAYQPAGIWNSKNGLYVSRPVSHRDHFSHIMILLASMWDLYYILARTIKNEISSMWNMAGMLDRSHIPFKMDDRYVSLSCIPAASMKRYLCIILYYYYCYYYYY